MAYSFLETFLGSLLKSFPSSRLSMIQLSSRAKAITLVLALLLVTFLSVGVAFSTAHTYFPLAVLGVFYGIMLSYPATKILGPKLQSALGGLLGGISLGNLSNKVATGTSAIRSVSQFINNSVQQILGTFPGISKSQYLEDGVVLCIWMALITMFLVIGINAYYQGESPKDALAATDSVVAHEPIPPIAQEHAAGG